MKRLILFIFLVALFGVSSLAFGANGQQQAQSDIVRNAGQAATVAVTSRVAAVAAPKPAGVKGNTETSSIDANGNFKFAMNAEDLGLASGDDSNSFGVWGLGSYTNFSSSATNAKYDADALNVFLGFDWRATPDFLIGIAGGWGSLDLDKKQWGNDNGTLKTDSEWTIMPYLAYNFTENTILDAAFSYSDTRYKDSNSTASGKYDSTRYLSSVGLSHYYLVDDWTLSGRLGYMYVHGDLKTYSRGGTDVANPDTWLGQLSVEGKAAYLFGNGAEPYAGLRYMYDVQTSTKPVDSDYDEFEGILGLNWYAGDQWTINMEGGASAGRSKYDSYRGQAYIRYEF